MFGFCVIIKKINKGDKRMKKVYIIAKSYLGTISIETTTDKEVMFKTIKKYTEQFINENENLESKDKIEAKIILSLKQIPKEIISFIKAYNGDGRITQAIALYIDGDNVLFKVQREEDGMSVAIHTYCPCELLEEK